MIKILSIALFILPVVLHAQLSNFEWAKSFNTSSSHFSSSIITDSSNNVYFCGRFEDTIDADPSTGVANLVSNVGYDIFIIKLDQNGNLIWGVSLGGAGWEDCLDMDIDSNQNIYLGGMFDETMDFDPGTGVNIVYCPANTTNAYLLKLDSDANFLWVKTLSTTISGISVDVNNNICLIGNFWSTTDFDPGPGTNNVSPPYFPVIPPNIPENIYVLKLDQNGNFIWIKQINGPSWLKPYKIETDEFANIFFTGLMSDGPIDFDPGPSYYYDSTTFMTFLGFTEKLDSNGNFEWVDILKSNYSTWCNDVDTDIEGNAYILGQFYLNTDVDPGPNYMPLNSNGGGDVLIQKIAPNGTLKWVQNIGGLLSDGGLGIHIDADKIFVAGLYGDSIDFDPNVGVDAKISNGYEEGFALCLDTNSTFNWVKSIGGNYYDRAIDIVTDKLDNVYFLGYYQDTVDLNPDFATQIEIDGPWGSGNAYVEKINRCYIKPNEVAVTTCDSFTWLNGITYFGNELISINLPEVSIDGCDSIIRLHLTINSVSNLATSINVNVITADNPNGEYQWIDCANGNNVITGATAQAYNALTNGEYAVIITENGCSDTSACILVSSIGLDQLSELYPKLYPNPGSESFTIDIGDLIDPELVIYSLNGNLIYQKEHIKDPFYNFKLEEAEGVYFVELKDSSKTIKFKLVKL